MAADVVEPLAPADRVVQVHRAAARHHENVVDDVGDADRGAAYPALVPSTFTSGYGARLRSYREIYAVFRVVASHRSSRASSRCARGGRNVSLGAVPGFGAPAIVTGSGGWTRPAVSRASWRSDGVFGADVVGASWRSPREDHNHREIRRVQVGAGSVPVDPRLRASRRKLPAAKFLSSGRCGPIRRSPGDNDPSPNSIA
jgi:hypothetical protein